MDSVKVNSGWAGGGGPCAGTAPLAPGPHTRLQRGQELRLSLPEPAWLPASVTHLCVLFQVQVIPWVLADSNFVRNPSQRLDPSRTVFVGALHGMLNAEALAAILNDLFGGVVYAGIDTDKHKYPIGERPPSVWGSVRPWEVAQECDTSRWEREAGLAQGCRWHIPAAERLFLAKPPPAPTLPLLP